MGMPSISARASISKVDSFLAVLATGETFPHRSSTICRVAIVAANACQKSLDCLLVSMGSFVGFEILRKMKLKRRVWRNVTLTCIQLQLFLPDCVASCQAQLLIPNWALNSLFYRNAHVRKRNTAYRARASQLPLYTYIRTCMQRYYLNNMHVNVIIMSMNTKWTQMNVHNYVHVCVGGCVQYCKWGT